MYLLWAMGYMGGFLIYSISYHKSFQVDLLVSCNLSIHHSDGVDERWHIDTSIRLTTAINRDIQLIK